MRSIRMALLVLLAAAAITNTSCKEEGPAEQAGEKIDRAAEQGADAAATAGLRATDAVDQ